MSSCFATNEHYALRIPVTKKGHLYVSGLDYVSIGSVQGFPAFEYCTISEAFLAAKT
jgi:hypothetical protein